MAAADPRVAFPGSVFGRGYWEPHRHAYLFCAPTEVGGTPPVILEAMAAANCVLVNDPRPNAETVGDAGVYFSGRAGDGALQGPPRRPIRAGGTGTTPRRRRVGRGGPASCAAAIQRYAVLTRGAER